MTRDKYCPPLQPAYTASRGLVGLSGQLPVRVSSWLAGLGAQYRVQPESPEFPGREYGDSWLTGLGAHHRVQPESPEFPGWEYGDLVFSPEWRDQRPHDHDFYEICIVRRGTAIHRTDFTEEVLLPGTAVVIAPGVAHSIYGRPDLWQTNVYYLAEWLSHDLSTYWGHSSFVPLFLAAALFRLPLKHPVPKVVLTADEMQDMDHELSDIGQECYTESSSQTFLKSTLLKFLIKLSRAYARRAPEELALGFRAEVMLALEHIEQTIQQCEPFDVKELAEKLRLSSSHFCLLFKRATGYPPMEYYQHRRVQHASRLLLNPQRTITEVAHEVGFFDSAHFSRLFREYKKMSPREYRKRCST